MFEVPASQVRKIPGGEYDTIVCNGEATLLRDVRCDRLVLGGTLGGPYSLSAGFIEGHGTLSVRGGIRTNEASFSGLTILRSTLQVAGTLQTAGYLHCQANVIAGAVSIDGNAHAEGTITTGRLRAFKFLSGKDGGFGPSHRRQMAVELYLALVENQARTVRRLVGISDCFGRRGVHPDR